MKTRRCALNALFTLALLAMVGMTFHSPVAMAGTSISPDVSTIENQVHHKLATLPWYGVFDNLQYQVNGTEVILSGQLVSDTM
jgi:hypothetical protein